MISSIRFLSCRIADMRKLFLKQTLALKGFLREAGQNWKESKYVYAISSTQAQIYQIQPVVKKLLNVNNKLIEIGFSLFHGVT